MNTIQALQQRIHQLCDAKEISINKLASLAGLPRSSVKNILYGKSQNPKIETIRQICDGFEISLSAFFDSDVFGNLESGGRE